MLTITGLIAVYSASFVIGLAEFGNPNYYIIRQLMWAGLGVVLLIGAVNTDYRRYRPLAVPFMAITIVMLVAVLAVGIDGGGAQRWLGVGAFTIQPAEFAKLTVCIYLAAWLAGNDSVSTWEHGLFPFILIISAVSLLIMLQPNLGTTLIILVITVTMFWVAGASVTQMAALAVTGIVAVSFLATVAGYRADRLTAFFHAEDDPAGNGFQTLQAVMAMGNGGIQGLGLGASRAKFFYVPESHTDGVFAIIGEELGLVCTLAVLLLYMILMVRGYQIASRCRDPFGRYMAAGITTWVTAQALLNIGGITRVIPLTGVPLPFISYGGNALAAVMLATGVLISISRYGNDRGGYMDRERTVVRRQPR